MIRAGLRCSADVRTWFSIARARGTETPHRRAADNGSIRLTIVVSRVALTTPRNPCRVIIGPVALTATTSPCHVGSGLRRSPPLPRIRCDAILGPPALQVTARPSGVVRSGAGVGARSPRKPVSCDRCAARPLGLLGRGAEVVCEVVVTWQMLFGVGGDRFDVRQKSRDFLGLVRLSGFGCPSRSPFQKGKRRGYSNKLSPAVPERVFFDPQGNPPAFSAP